MQMVDSFTSRSGPLFLHFDGEFASGEDLVVGTLTGRNFGWLPSQYNQAIAHIARIIREDDGSSQLAADRLDGLSYAVIFKGTDPRIGPFEDHRIAQPIQPVGSKLAAAVILADDPGDVRDRLIVLRGQPTEITPSQRSYHEVLARGELSIEMQKKW